MSSEMRNKHAEALKAVRSVFDGIPAPCAERDALDFAIALLARTEAGPSLLCQSDACAHKGTVHNFCKPRTEAGADGAVAWGLMYPADHEQRGTLWNVAVEKESAEQMQAACWNAGDDLIVPLYHRPQDASGDAESTALYLRPYDVTMIGQAKHAGQDMVSVLAKLHPTEGWGVRFNVAAMQAKEAK